VTPVQLESVASYGPVHSPGAEICSVAASASVVATCSNDGTICLLDRAGMHLGAVLTGHKDDVRSVALATSQDGEEIVNLVVSGGRDKTVRLWDARLPSWQPVHTFEGHAGWVHGVDIGEGAGVPRIASCSGDKTVRLWNLATMQEEQGKAPGDVPTTNHRFPFCRYCDPWETAKVVDPIIG